jgi:TetR/AcrR family tetracycline transcriptional repressor
MSTKPDTTAIRRDPLSRDRILQVAMRIADAEGHEALSMRRIAAELDATPMALYNHVPNKEALLTGIAGRLLEEIDLAAIDFSDWTTAIKSGYGEFRRVLLRHPNLLPILQRKSEVSPDAMRPIELALSILRSAGLTTENAFNAHCALTGFTMGHVLWQVTSPLFDEEGGAAHALEHQRMLPADQFPNIHEALPSIENCDMDAAFDFGMDAIIEGLKTKIASQAP